MKNLFRQKRRLPITLHCILLLSLLFFCCKVSCETSDEKKIPSAKYIFLLIGDGMGTDQVQVTEDYLKSDKTYSANTSPLCFKQFPYHSLTCTNSLSGTTDSAAAGTALSCGSKTKKGMLGQTADGKALVSNAEYAQQCGMNVGIITDVPINHATPAAFYGHVNSRNEYTKILQQLPKSGIQFIVGSKAYVSNNNKIDTEKFLVQNGYQVLKTDEQLKTMDNINGKLAILYPIPFYIDHSTFKPNLADFLSMAIRRLNTPNGFFIMVEGGRIDWTCHANDLGTSLKEVVAFNNMVKVAYDFYLKHPEETLIIVTADHETGGLKYTGKPSVKLKKAVDSQRCSNKFLRSIAYECKRENWTINKLKQELAKRFGLADLTPGENEQLEKAFTESRKNYTPDKRPQKYIQMYGSRQPIVVTCMRILSKRAGATWSTFGHSAAKVGTFAIGPGAQLLAKENDNTDIAKLIRKMILQHTKPIK